VTTHAPLELYAGDTWQFDLSLHDGAGNALDLTDADVAWTLHTSAGVDVLALSVGNGITIEAPPTDGRATVLVTSEQTALPLGSYYDVTRATVGQNDFVTTQAVGFITVIDRPSQPDTGPVDWVNIDWNDPCGTLAILRPKFYAVMAGGGVVSVKHGNDSVTYSEVNFAKFESLIRGLEEKCAKLQGAPRRYAMRLGALNRRWHQ
jgi:hypothetical protein